MKTTTLKESAVVEEALEVLFRYLTPVKVAKFLSTWQWDGKNYAGIRKKLFEGETVESLSVKIKGFEKKHVN